jgi:hypothetical protein
MYWLPIIIDGSISVGTGTAPSACAAWRRARSS